MVDLTPQYVLNGAGMSSEQIYATHRQVRLEYYKALAETFAQLLSDATIRQGIAMVTTPPQTENGVVLP